MRNARSARIARFAVIARNGRYARAMCGMRVMRELRVMRVYPYESQTSLRCSLGGNESHCSVPIVPMEMKVDLRPITGKRKYKV